MGIRLNNRLILVNIVEELNGLKYFTIYFENEGYVYPKDLVLTISGCLFYLLNQLSLYMLRFTWEQARIIA